MHNSSSLCFSYYSSRYRSRKDHESCARLGGSDGMKALTTKIIGQIYDGCTGIWVSFFRVLRLIPFADPHIHRISASINRH